MNAASSAARAARRTQIWRGRNAALFTQPDLSETLEASIARIIQLKQRFGDDYASIELDSSGDHVEISQAWDVRQLRHVK